VPLKASQLFKNNQKIIEKPLDTNVVSYYLCSVVSNQHQTPIPNNMTKNPIITVDQIQSLMAIVVDMNKLSDQSEAKRMEYVNNGNGSSYEVKSGFLLGHIHYNACSLGYLLASIDANEA